MGQAKRRGTFEERKAQAIQRADAKTLETLYRGKHDLAPRIRSRVPVATLAAIVAATALRKK